MDSETLFDVNNPDFLDDFKKYIQISKKALIDHDVDLTENSNKIEIFITYVLDELNLFDLGATWCRSKNGVDIYSRRKHPELYRRIAYEVKSSNVSGDKSKKNLTFSSMYDLETIKKTREKNDYVLYYMHHNDYPKELWICEKNAVFDLLVEKYKKKKGQRTQNLQISFKEFKELGATKINIPDKCIDNIFHYQHQI